MSLNKELFKLVILPGRDPDPKYASYYQNAYNCWVQVWEEAYKELKVDKTIFSDEFTRQTEICTIFYGDECVAMLFLTWADFSNPIIKNDSYFKIWSSEDLTKLTINGPYILICSNTTISKAWRKSSCEISIKDLILYLTCYQRFKHTGADALTGVTRRARGIHELCYRFGAVPLRENLVHFDDKDRVDIVAFYQNSIKEGTDQIVIELGRRMWRNKIQVRRVITEMPQILPFTEIKKRAA